MVAAAPDTVVIVLPTDTVDPYGTLRSAAQLYRRGFEESGYRTVPVDLGRFTREDVAVLGSPRVRLIFSDGGWINTVLADTASGKTPLVDVLGKPVLVLLNDSPCSYWMAPILVPDRPNQTTAMLDPDFANQWARWVEPAGKRQLYIPACQSQPPTGQDRSIRHLVVASVRDPEQYRASAVARGGDPLVRQVFDGVADTLLSDALLPLSAACDGVCRTLGCEFDWTAQGNRKLLHEIDYFVRNRRRQRMLQAAAGQPITLVGGGTGFDLHPDSVVIPPMPHRQLLELYARAESVIVAPPYMGGISERMTHAMGAGALVVSPPTVPSDRLMGRDRLFVTCAGDFSDLGECLERARDPALREPMAANAHAVALRDFSPAATVRRLLAGMGISDR